MKLLLGMRRDRASTLSLRALVFVSAASVVGAFGRSEIALSGQLPGGWAYHGCYKALVNQHSARRDDITSKPWSAASCVNHCNDLGYVIAGTDENSDCHCGSSVPSSAELASSCDIPGLISVYRQSAFELKRRNPELVGRQGTAVDSSAVASSTTSEPAPSDSTPAQPPGWYPLGCYVDYVPARSLSIGVGVNGGMTNAKCQAACQAAGYILAGTEYSGECYCDNQLRNRGAPAPDGNANCNMNCNGNQTEICGGPDRLTLFQYYSGQGPTSSSTSLTSATIVTQASSVPASSTSNAVPSATGLPPDFEYKGCYVDNANGQRVMNYEQPNDPNVTPGSCAYACAKLGYEIAAIEYASQCFCDNYIRQGGQLASDPSTCNMGCAGDSSQICGGPNRLSVYSNQDPLQLIGVPAPVQNVSGWVYQGCLTDNGEGGRTFPWQLVNQTGNSPEWCLGKCAEFGYMAAGMEYGQECYCGDIDGITKNGATERPESECNTACPGNATAICGSGNRLTWYKWEADPLYVWDYPTGAAAGKYEFLVGGPVIPLISQPGVNGKVSFLEKHGTGPPNSTGAYEFDPSIGGDIFHAFREMYGLKTDIFCAAGLTMPDRAGRQINIGGWSADSLFGVRIYWPDGSPGVNGTNDWQEDVNAVKLQRGRWYPTGLVMANGSMLIVGGEDGSNGPPVPNMEILPTVGPVYEADYLRATDPYNLYPYLVVLPSGGIFIGYYNEARILDEASLDTVKILPKIPATVNDPSGGRTYPLEGTQVLLPQYYPYTDPLEVLICGGAARQPAWGIDNCVSIAPDAPNPVWTLERMPSRRVMSCMATLPDGTFLILNGAETGAAGFGLADNPNLNALLYDSRKPVNSRISVMANTTIARMYHSEAALLDDGRVLVSGSDPEDADYPQEYRVEVFLPPYLLSGAAQPSFEIPQNDWIWEAEYSFTVTSSSGGELKVSLLGSESSTHGSSMGARILFPQFSCAGNACTVTAPKGPYIAPVGWYRMFVLDGPTPSHAKWVRIGGDPGQLGNWPNAEAFLPLPGVGPVADGNASAEVNGTAAAERKFRA